MVWKEPVSSNTAPHPKEQSISERILQLEVNRVIFLKQGCHIFLELNKHIILAYIFSVIKQILTDIKLYYKCISS